MKKIVTGMAALILAASLSVGYAQDAVTGATVQKKKVTTEQQDSVRVKKSRTFRERAQVAADSIRAKGTRFGQRAAEGTAVFVDSVGAKGQRIGEKAMPMADTVVTRTRKAWKALKGE